MALVQDSAAAGSSSRSQNQDSHKGLLAPQKIACGNAHTLYLGNFEEKAKIKQSRLYGWGGNRHNQLGLIDESAERLRSADASASKEKDGNRRVGADGKGYPSAQDRVTDKVFNQQVIRFSKDPEYVASIIARAAPAASTVGEAFTHKLEYMCESASGTQWVRLDEYSMHVYIDFDSDGASPGAIPPRPGAYPFTYEDKIATRDLYEVACGGNYTVLLERLKQTGDGEALAESRVWSFGLKANGKLGQEGAKDDGKPGPPAEVVFQVAAGVSGRIAVQRISCGSDHTLAIVNFVGASGGLETATGRVFAWGIGSFGALGTKSKSDEWTPSEVWFPEDGYSDSPFECDRRVHINQVAAGYKHSLAFGCHQQAHGVVYAWGHGGNGRLGLGKRMVGDAQSSSAEFEPKLVDMGSSKIKYVAAGEAHSGAVDQLGGLFTWGQGSHGRCGHGLATDTAVPTRVESLLGVAIKQISFGLMHSVATTVKGQLYAWGKGPATGLDAGDNAAILTPRIVELPDQYNDPVYQVATGPLHTLVLMSNGSLYYFGSGSEHRMPLTVSGATGVNLDQPFPKKLDAAPGFQHDRSDAAGGEQALMLQDKAADAQKAEWPREVHCGGATSMTMLENGDLWVWGDAKLTGAAEREGMAEGDLVDEEAEVESLWQPTKLRRGFRNAVAVRMVAMGMDHCLAITEDLVMYAWGDGSKGQLGTGSLKRAIQPQAIIHPTDVIKVSAGEEHSACIIGGGESYTWGNAEGGRLGQGGCLSEGLQLQPKQVTIPAGSDVLLRSVSCGSQHTALVSEEARLLTFGTGWFGRLGHGDMSNQYSPAFVESEIASGVREVHCAMYHTCIVANDGVLWVCGRDSSICCDGIGHQLTPVPFEPFCLEPRRYVRKLATTEQHTIVVTQMHSPSETTQDVTPAVEMWVWGKNSRGQLGIASKTAPKIDMPWQLRLPGLDRPGSKPSYDITHVATAMSHTLCVVRPNARRGQVAEPIVYAWGFDGDGRLGQQERAEPVNTLEGGEQLALAAQQGPPGTRCELPAQVDPRWRPRHKEEHVSHKDDAFNMRTIPTGPSTCWLDLQRKQFAEDPAYRKQRLLEQREEVEKVYQSYLLDIMNLWTRPAAGADVTEYNIRQKERELESQFLRTVQALGLRSHAPKLDKSGVQTETAIQQSLHLYEELLWILQQQPLYLANLATRLWGLREEKSDVKRFYSITQRLFAEMSNSRVRNHFKALLRVAMLGEVQNPRVQHLEDVFDPAKSRVTGLFTQLCTNSHFVAKAASRILDPDDDDSLMSRIIQYTLSKDGKTLRIWQRSTSSIVSGVFVGNYEEYLDLQQSTDKEKPKRRTDGGAEKSGPNDDSSKLRQVYTEEVSEFGRFIWHDESKGEKATSAKQIESFVKDFTTFICAETWNDIQMLLVTAFKCLVSGGEPAGRLVVAQRGTEREADMCRPLTALLLGSLIGGTLQALKTTAYASYRMKISARVRELHRHFRSSAAGSFEANSGLPVATADEKLLELVEFNVSALARFFQRVVHKDMYELQYPASQARDPEKGWGPEENSLRERARRLERTMNDCLYEKLKPHMAGESPESLSSDGAFCQDTTEVDLTIDLYTTHYRLNKDMVWLTASDLMLLTNMIFKYMKTVSTKDASILLDTSGGDRLGQLVRKILPREVTKNDIGEEVMEEKPWNEGMLWIGQKVNEWHNFTMRGRFLEYQSKGEAEPMFCAVTNVPIPRWLASEQQKKFGNSCAVKPLPTPERYIGPGPEVVSEIVKCYPYDFLSLVLQDLSGSRTGENKTNRVRYPIRGTTWIDLRNELESYQHKLFVAIEEGRAQSGDEDLLHRVGLAKAIVAKLWETGAAVERDFRDFVDKTLEGRAAYARYLRLVQNGAQRIEEAQKEYKTRVKDEFRRLNQIVAATETCDMPEDILAQAQQHSQRLAFTRAKRLRQKMRKDNPTPAQITLEQLLRANGGAKVTEEIMDMVGVPTRTFTLAQLTRKGVITRMNDGVKDIQNQLQFTFQFENEGFSVQVFMKTTLVKEMRSSCGSVAASCGGCLPGLSPRVVCEVQRLHKAASRGQPSRD
eukprot:TRINITY_DN12067_c0_g2_i1.p1 TRINITY_DN12067_c0_g2~~TRINITY_DN12067_c0_g2_i1.p1  ORF type:complete len:2068 (-),score=517.76 TRINITY_DN12067_c0_g2_i1:63-6266(-)